ncbi:MAG: hypothetical protein FWH26_10585 [Oscillospiraceae bacterium]|nr:hypothetical protein [Oscillospiraceae bacterium]
MKKFGRFALIICLCVLALALVLSIANPRVLEAMTEGVKAFGTGIGNFFEKLAEGFRVAFAE